MSPVEALLGALPEAGRESHGEAPDGVPGGSLDREVPMPNMHVGSAGVVTQRPGESDSNWKRRARIAQNIVRYGIRVHCINCQAKGRHFVEKNGPLRQRACPNCDKRTLKRTAHMSTIRQAIDEETGGVTR